MLRKIEKTCTVCGSKYEMYCPSCPESVKQPIYLNSFCSENCKKIYTGAAGYNGKTLTKLEAKGILDSCDLTNKANFTPATQRLIAEIYSVDSIEVHESVVSDEDEQEPIKEETVVKTPETKFKKKKK